MTETFETTAGRAAATTTAPPAGLVASTRRLSLATLFGLATAVAGTAVLAVRIVGDVHAKPLFEDEAVAGLVAARPLPEVFHTVWWERGGSPLHFLLAHLALVPDGSPFALRWLSVSFALATVPLSWDLGRRLAGSVAAGTAALVVATSSLLWIYGSFGRMYALYAFGATLAVDLFVRAERLRTGRAALAAAGAAWLLPAIHPYGIFLVAAEALVALALWRGRPLRPALPVVALGLAVVPFLVADVRLAERFSVGLEGGRSVAGAGRAWGEVWRALEASVGGSGWTFAVALALAAAGIAVLAVERRAAFLALAAVAGVLPPILLLVARTSGDPGLSPRHLAYLLPFVAALVGVGAARVARALGPPGPAIALVAAGVLLVSSPPGGVVDPRNWHNDVLGGGPAGVALGSPERLAGPAAWLEREVEPGAVLYPYSAVYLAALPATRHGDALPYAQRATLLRALDRVATPAPELVVSVPIGQTRLDWTRLQKRLRGTAEPVRFGGWLLLRGEGPYADDAAVLAGVYRALSGARAATVGPRRGELRWYYHRTISVVCSSLREGFAERCSDLRR